MRLLFAGATGVLGQATLAHLEAHCVVGLTRTGDKLQLLRELGAEGVVCDVYDADELLRVARETRPHVVVNFLTDLSAGSGEANNRVRREGNANLVNAAKAVAAQRFVVESVAFPLEGAAAQALEQMEQTALEAPFDVLILRFGRLWGPSTWYQDPPDPPLFRSMMQALERRASSQQACPVPTTSLTVTSGRACGRNPPNGWRKSARRRG
jgi:nucleoside-diphosphate-sugar epimerase